MKVHILISDLFEQNIKGVYSDKTEMIKALNEHVRQWGQFKVVMEDYKISYINDTDILTYYYKTIQLNDKL